jgi:RNA polymerase sigma factor (sigma-70 family)
VLETLSPKHREVLELQYLGDMTQAQIAARLDVPLGTVKSAMLTSPATCSGA